MKLTYKVSIIQKKKDEEQREEILKTWCQHSSLVTHPLKLVFGSRLESGGDLPEAFIMTHGVSVFSDQGYEQRDLILANETFPPVAVSVLPELHYFPLSVRPFVLRPRRDTSTFLDNLMVYTLKTIYFLSAYHLG